MFSPGARLYVAVTPSVARNVPLPVVRGFGSAAPSVLLFGSVVQVAGRALIVKSAPLLVMMWLSGAPSAATKLLPLPVVSGLGSASPYVLLFAVVVQVAARLAIVKSAPLLV